MVLSVACVAAVGSSKASPVSGRSGRPAVRFACASLSVLGFYACANSSERSYVSDGVVSASAFTLRTSLEGAYGKYLYSYLVPQPHGPQVSSLTFDVSIHGSILELRDTAGHACQPWRVNSITPHLLAVNVGPEVVSYVSDPPYVYEEQVEVLRSFAKALRGYGGGVIDYFKPICSP
jgi:hypothetical protein